MSYDLLFHSRSGASFDASRFKEWLSTRANYDVFADQAEYENEETDVHFMLEFTGERYFEDQPAPDLIALVNFIRPTPFADEASHELGRIAEAFDLEVVNPQEDGNERENWDSGRFIANYQDHAARALRSLWASDAALPEQREAMEDATVPRSKLHKAWLWNFQKPRLYEWIKACGRDLFVPTLQFIQIDKRLYDCFVWSDGVPSVFPETSHVLLFRERLAWRPTLSLSTGRPTFELVPIDVINPLINQHYERVSEWPGCRLAKSDVSPRELSRDLKARRPGDGAVNRYFYQDNQRQGSEDERMNLGRVDGFEQDEGRSQRDDGPEVPGGFLAA